MKYLLLLLSILMSGGQALYECNTSSEFVFKLPDGFAIRHTFEENGLLTAVDEFGNSVDIYAEYNSDVSLLEISGMSLIDREEFEDGSYRLRIDNPGPIDPYDTIVVVPKEGFVLRAYIFRQGEPQTHGVFEEKAMQLVRNIAPGGNDGKVWKDCLGSTVRFFADVNGG